MKKKLTAEEIIALHVQYDKEIEQALNEGNSAKNNRAVKKLNCLEEYLQENLELAEEIYPKLFFSECLYTRKHAAGECLRMNIFVSEALDIWRDLAQRADAPPLLSHSAEYALKKWYGEF